MGALSDVRFFFLEVSVSCLVTSDSLRPQGSSVHGILQARILEWIAVPFSRGSSQPRNRTLVCCLGREILYHLSHRASPILEFKSRS